MLRRELIKIGLGLLLGLIIGLVLAINSDTWSLLYMMPLYVVGFIYSFHYLVRLLGTVCRFIAGALSLSLGTANCLGFGLSLLLMAVLCVALISVVWIVGIVLAIWSIIRAVQEDGRFNAPVAPFGQRRRQQNREFSQDDYEDQDEDSIW